MYTSIMHMTMLCLAYRYGSNSGPDVPPIYAPICCFPNVYHRFPTVSLVPSSITKSFPKVHMFAPIIGS